MIIKILGVLVLLTLSAFFYSVNADVSVTPPKDWQSSPLNNSTAMIWFQNSTKSAFTIASMPFEFNFGLFLVSGIMAQALAERGMLESMDQITFGRSNFGYRYIVNLSSPQVNLSSPYIPSSLIDYPFQVAGPMKALLILSQKHNITYAIALMSPRDNFDSVSNQIQPSLDSIQITKPPPSDVPAGWKEYNSTLGVGLEYPATWYVNSTWDGEIPANSICDPATGTCFNIIIAMECGFTETDLDLVSGVWLNSSVNSSSGDKLVSPLQVANYTIDGEKAKVFSAVFTIRDTDVVAEQQDIVVTHNGTVYVFEFGGHFSTFSKPEVKEIGEHIIKSIQWSEPTFNTKIKWNKYVNSTLGLSFEYPSGWDVNSSDPSVCDPVTGTCFQVIHTSTEPVTMDILTLSGLVQDAFVNTSSGDELIKTTEISNYTIDGELAGEFTKRLTTPDTNDIFLYQNIVVVHDGKVYLLLIGSYPSEFNKSETNEIREHIIKSIKWTQ